MPQSLCWHIARDEFLFWWQQLCIYQISGRVGRAERGAASPGSCWKWGKRTAVWGSRWPPNQQPAGFSYPLTFDPPHSAPKLSWSFRDFGRLISTMWTACVRGISPRITNTSSFSPFCNSSVIRNLPCRYGNQGLHLGALKVKRMWEKNFTNKKKR